jgi:hypothetical protein
VREAPDARNTRASLQRDPEFIFPHALDGHFNQFRTGESGKSPAWATKIADILRCRCYRGRAALAFREK